MALDKLKIEEILNGGEDDSVEYKEKFDWNEPVARSNYMKSMAALCNNNGGYLVFGISNSNVHIGIVDDFDKLDPAEITRSLAAYFQPIIRFRKECVEYNGKHFGILDIQKWDDIPSVCRKDDG
jgi:ATP-dependent DNA helicase RecG